ncbi:Molecular chaperone (small heat-shock protein Hsp26/Hsp42) [Handroanthus impetiginosus]|uniref:Molecular chaperone (Small heat-shock protein Hsp26/Hsp42) n=1 Tax=Handroanthus impetiginosus TaxID=429701 RepID=A0A2G9HQ18_9LAMI|nr:Molecular chaperone (small heat-shock protein Hsp26/Hsp42) [Handroanthus impetiginosus]
MSSSKQVEIKFEDPNPQKWCHPLKEDVYAALKNKENSLLHKTGSLFSPLLFGKFFDPSDAFPLWEFESDSLLPSSCSVEWFQTDTDYVLKAQEIPGLGNDIIQVCIENGKILEISGQQRECRTKDWKKCKWWEHGYVRRIELPDQTDWRKAEAYIKNDVVLEIKMPKIPPDRSHTA